MKEKLTIQEQVAKMTEAEQNKVFKTGLIFFIIEILFAVPYIILLLDKLSVLIDPPGRISSDAYDQAFTELMLWAIGGIVVAILLFVLLKIICPQYNDRKWFYIFKLRRAKKNK